VPGPPDIFVIIIIIICAMVPEIVLLIPRLLVPKWV